MKYGVGPQDAGQKGSWKDVATFGAVMSPGSDIAREVGISKLEPTISEDIKNKRWMDALLKTISTAGDVGTGTGAVMMATGAGAVPGAAVIGASQLAKLAAKAARKAKVPDNLSIKISNSDRWDNAFQRTYGQGKVESAYKKRIKQIEKANKDGKKINDYELKLPDSETVLVENVALNPKILKNVQGVHGEHIVRDSGQKLKRLEKNIKEKGYKQKDPIQIYVREDGTPFINEGNHRVAEAIKNNRPIINARIHYKGGSEKIEGPLNPFKILPEEKATDISTSLNISAEDLPAYNKFKNYLNTLQNKIQSLLKKNKLIGKNKAPPPIPGHTRVYHGTRSPRHEDPIYGKQSVLYVTPDVKTAEQFSEIGLTRKHPERIYPLKIKTNTIKEKIFDPSNEKHLKKLKENSKFQEYIEDQLIHDQDYLKDNIGKPIKTFTAWLKEFKKNTYYNNNYSDEGVNVITTTLEKSKEIQNILKKLGFDGFTIIEGNSKNIGLFLDKDTGGSKILKSVFEKNQGGMIMRDPYKREERFI